MTTLGNIENRNSMLGKDDKFCKKSILQMLLTTKRRSQRGRGVKVQNWPHILLKDNA